MGKIFYKNYGERGPPGRKGGPSKGQSPRGIVKHWGVGNRELRQDERVRPLRTLFFFSKNKRTANRLMTASRN